MGADFIHKIQRGSNVYTFSDTSPTEYRQWEEDELRFTVPSAETPGTDGEYQADGSAEARMVTLPGHLQGDDPDDLRDKWDALVTALTGGGPHSAEAKVYRHSDRYIAGRVVMVKRDSDEGFNFLEWTLGLRCADPFYYADSTETVALATGGGATSLTVIGGYAPLPVFTLEVSHQGTVQVSHGGHSFTLTLTSTGTYLVDCALGVVVKDDTDDAIDTFSGEFFDEGLILGATSITIALSDGATLSDASVEYRPRWAGG
jgi:phage-related protein